MLFVTQLKKQKQIYFQIIFYHTGLKWEQVNDNRIFFLGWTILLNEAESILIGS